MAITRTAMVDDDGSGTTGTIINNAWKTELYNQIDGAVAAGGSGAVTDRAFTPADYAARAPLVLTMSSALSNSYAVTGKVATWSVAAAVGSTTGSQDSLLYVTLPPGLVPARYAFFPMAVLKVGGTAKAGLCYVTPGGTTLTCQATDGAFIPAGSAIEIDFTISFFVN